MERSSRGHLAALVIWVRIFNWALAAPALLWAVAVFIAYSRSNPAEDDHIELYVLGATLGLLFPLPAAIALKRGRVWTYYFQVATLTVGTLFSFFSFCIYGLVYVFPALILLYYWLRPEVRAYMEGKQ